MSFQDSADCPDDSRHSGRSSDNKFEKQRTVDVLIGVTFGRRKKENRELFGYLDPGSLVLQMQTGPTPN